MDSPTQNVDKVNAARNNLIMAIDNIGSLKDVSRLYCTYVLAKTAGHMILAAEKLGIDRRTMQRWNIKR